MSLAVAVKGPEGVVVAVDSRVTLQVQTPNKEILPINFDNATKFLSFNKPHNFVGTVTYGAAVIGLRTAHSLVPEFEPLLGDKRMTVLEYAKKLSAFFMEQWSKVMPKDYGGPEMNFIVAGYDSAEPYGKVFLFGIPRQPDPEPRNADNFGMTWGGQLQLVSRIIHGFDPVVVELLRERLSLDQKSFESLITEMRQSVEFRIPYEVLPLQDCVNLAAFLIRTTIVAQSLAVGVRGVGGPVEIATITRTEGLKYVQRKSIHGETVQSLETSRYQQRVS